MRYFVAVVFLATGLAGCHRRATGTGILPPPPANPKLSSWAPAQPFQPAANGAMIRTVYRAEAIGPLQAEVQDNVVPPGKELSVAFKGAAVLDVRSGSGAFIVGQRTDKLQTGSAFGLSDGERVQITNNSKEPLVLRIYLVSQR